jgi:WD40 repeat protein
MNEDPPPDLFQAVHSDKLFVSARYFLLGRIAKFLLVIGCLAASACMMLTSNALAEDNALGHEIRTVSFPQSVGDMVWSPDQTHLAVIDSSGYFMGQRSGHLYLYDSVKDEAPKDMKAYLGDNIYFDQTGKFIIGTAFPPRDPSNTDRYQEIASRNGLAFALVPVDGGAPARYVKDEKIDDFPHDAPKNSRFKGRLYRFNRMIALSSDGATLASSLGGDVIALYDAKTLGLEKNLGLLKYPLPFHPDDTVSFRTNYIAVDSKQKFVVAANNTHILTWDVGENKEVKLFSPYENGSITAFAFSPATESVITGTAGFGPDDVKILQSMHVREYQGVPVTEHKFDADTVVRAWDLRTGEQTMTYKTPGSGDVDSLAVSIDGKYLAATRGGHLVDAYVILWDAASGQLLASMNYGKGHLMHGVAFSPDSKKLAYAIDNTMRIVEINPAQPKRE